MIKFLLKIFSFIIMLLMLLFATTGCEDVVEVDLNTAAPRLVVDASIKWYKGTNGNEQIIKLTTTTGFYDTQIPVVSNAQVQITNSSNDVFVFTEVPNSGIYSCSNFNPVLNETYTLTIIYNGNTYKATEKLMPCPTIQNVEQTNNGGFDGESIELKFFFQDNGQESNYYLYQINAPYSVFPEYSVLDDTNFQGNQMFEFYTDEDLKASDEIIFTLHGISEKYYNYMNILLNIAGSNSGSPFSTPPATVRGNMVNQTNFDNFALGFFRLSEVDTKTYVVQ